MHVIIRNHCALVRRVIADDGHETKDLKNKAIYEPRWYMGWTVSTMTITCGNGHDIIQPFIVNAEGYHIICDKYTI